MSNSKLRYVKISRNTETTTWAVMLAPKHDQIYVSDFMSEEKAMQSDLYYGHEIKIELAANIDADALDALLETDKIKNAFARVVAGYTQKYDGRRYMPVFNADAETATTEIQTLIENCDTLQSEIAGAWSAGDWFSNISASEIGITEKTTDDEIEKITENLISEAEGELVKLSFADVMNWCLERRPSVS
jgi:hypothetical protein